VFSFFVSLLKDKVCKPSVFRGKRQGLRLTTIDVIHTILRYVGDKGLQEQACELLLDVCNKALAGNSKEKMLQLERHLNEANFQSFNEPIHFADSDHSYSPCTSKNEQKNKQTLGDHGAFD
jgi:hypothetical protein